MRSFPLPRGLFVPAGYRAVLGGCARASVLTPPESDFLANRQYLAARLSAAWAPSHVHVKRVRPAHSYMSPCSHTHRNPSTACQTRRSPLAAGLAKTPCPEATLGPFEPVDGEERRSRWVLIGLVCGIGCPAPGASEHENMACAEMRAAGVKSKRCRLTSTVARLLLSLPLRVRKPSAAAVVYPPEWCTSRTTLQP